MFARSAARLASTLLVALASISLLSPQPARAAWRKFVPEVAGGQFLGIALGLDGDVWLTAVTNDVMLRYESGGRFSLVQTGGYQLGRMVRGANGDFYAIAGTSSRTIVRISLSGKITPILLNDTAGALTAGADGSVWAAQGSFVTRIFAGGAMRVYSLPSGDLVAGSSAIAEVPGRDVWFNAYTPGGPAYLAALNPRTGRITKHLIGACGPNVYGPMAGGPDGRLWTLCKSEFVGVAPNGGVVRVAWPRQAHLVGTQQAAVVGPDNALWIVAAFDRRGTLGAAIVRFDVVTHRFHVYVAPRGYDWENSLTFDPDGNVWAGCLSQVHELMLHLGRRQ
jgi:streptogramin lyase